MKSTKELCGHKTQLSVREQSSSGGHVIGFIRRHQLINGRADDDPSTQCLPDADNKAFMMVHYCLSKVSVCLFNLSFFAINNVHAIETKK